MGSSRTRLTKLLGATLVLGLGGCDRSDTARTPPPETTTPPGGLEQAGPGSSTQPVAAADVSSLDDAERAAVLRAIDRRIVEEAQLAETNAGSDDIKHVARELFILHRDEMSGDGTIFARDRLDRAGSPISQRIDSDTDSALEVMRALTGRAFDSDFLDEQIRAHREGIDLLDRMFPSVKNADLKAEMLRTRPALTIYLVTLTRLQRGIGVAERQGADPAEKPRY